MPIDRPSMPTLRDALGLTQPEMARLLGVSVRTLAGLEGGGEASEQNRRRLREATKLLQGLRGIMKPDFIPDWLRTPNEMLAGLKPIEAIERGESDLVWRVIHYAGAGEPA